MRCVAFVGVFGHSRDMTINEARYVLAHRHEFDAETVRYAMDIIESAERQGIA